MVIAYMGKLGDRDIFEKAGVRAFSFKGMDVGSLYETMGEVDKTYKADPEQLRDFMISNQMDGYIEIRFVSLRKEETSSESQYPTRREYRIMDDANYDKLINEYGKREEKGAIYEDIKVKMDIRLFNRAGDRYVVVWSSRTESSNPRNNQAIAEACTRVAKKAMKKQGILP